MVSKDDNVRNRKPTMSHIQDIIGHHAVLVGGSAHRTSVLLVEYVVVTLLHSIMKALG